MNVENFGQFCGKKQWVTFLKYNPLYTGIFLLTKSWVDQEEALLAMFVGVGGVGSSRVWRSIGTIDTVQKFQ